MRQMLEGLVLLGALLLAAFVIHEWWGRRAAPVAYGRSAGTPAVAHVDVEDPSSPAPRVPPRRAVSFLPPINLSTPPRPRRNAPPPPPPPAQ